MAFGISVNSLKRIGSYSVAAQYFNSMIGFAEGNKKWVSDVGVGTVPLCYYDKDRGLRKQHMHMRREIDAEGKAHYVLVLYNDDIIVFSPPEEDGSYAVTFVSGDRRTSTERFIDAHVGYAFSVAGRAGRLQLLRTNSSRTKLNFDTDFNGVSAQYRFNAQHEVELERSLFAAPYTRKLNLKDRAKNVKAKEAVRTCVQLALLGGMRDTVDYYGVLEGKAKGAVRQLVGVGAADVPEALSDAIVAVQKWAFSIHKYAFDGNSEKVNAAFTVAEKKLKAAFVTPSARGGGYTWLDINNVIAGTPKKYFYGRAAYLPASLMWGE